MSAPVKRVCGIALWRKVASHDITSSTHDRGYAGEESLIADPKFLGYGLDDTIPNHSVLSKARKRWGQEVFVAVFSRVVAQCVRAGLVEGTKIHADSSLVAANASLNSVRELDAVTLGQIQRACREQTEKLDETEANQDEKKDDQDPDLPPPGPRTETNQKYQSSTDPEATLVRQHGFKTRPRYKNHRVVDDAQGVITAVRTTTGRINESHELTELIDQHQTNTQIAAETIVADCKYGTIENYIDCQKRKLRTHMADLLASSPGSGRRESIQDLLIATVQNLRKLIGAIQNAPGSAWKPLIRTLSRLYTMLSTLLTPDPPRQRV
jgi:Transposase DDE domain